MPVKLNRVTQHEAGLVARCHVLRGTEQQVQRGELLFAAPGQQRGEQGVARGSIAGEQARA